ncbi:MAG TPA: DUF3052 domain-containing protein [Actinomycetota bacterium]|nr:DUF3052 domain-containing protein [Actinomycetota bacterium]
MPDRRGARPGHADYSGTPLPRKLGIRPGATVALLDAPEGAGDLLGPLPDGVVVRRRAQGGLDVVVLFVTSRARLAARFGPAARALVPDGGLWVAWPRKGSGVPTDLDFDAVQRVGLDDGLVDNKVAAIDQVWTSVRFVVRVADRPGRRAAGHRPGR